MNLPYQKIGNSLFICSIESVEKYLSMEQKKAIIASFITPITANNKIQEKIAIRYLLQQIQPFAVLQYHTYKKPYLENSKVWISISHSKDKAAIGLHSAPIGIDIQAIQDKIVGIASKFVHTMDYLPNSTPTTLTIIWAAKESIFKYYSPHYLSFKEDIHILFINNNYLKIAVKLPTTTVLHTVYYSIVEQDYVVCSTSIGSL